MFVKVSREAVSVEEADDLKRFHVALHGVSDEDGLAALVSAGAVAEAGAIENDHTWIGIDYLKANAASVDPAWSEQFDGMVGYATSKGWVSEDGTALQAHVERVS